MPYLHLTTNVEIQDAKYFVQEFSALASNALNKPEQYISINYTYNELLSFDGNFDPAFILIVTSLGTVNPEANITTSGTFFKFFESKLGISGKRGYISFNDPGRENLGYNGTTFAALAK